MPGLRIRRSTRRLPTTCLAALRRRRPARPSLSRISASQSNSHQTSEEPAEPTVLVFRDGHREKIANYAIMGSTLFVLSGPRARIPVAELDIPATERVNQDRGIDFKVPKAQ